MSIHYIAYYFHPAHINLSINESTKSAMPQFFRDYTDSFEEATKLEVEFVQFRCQMGEFTPARMCWRHKDNLLMFWMVQKDATTVLSNLAIRIYSCPANSVPSERAFSTQNIIHTKVHNRLQSEHIDGLVFMFMNRCVLQQMESQKAESKIINKLLNASQLCNLSEAEELEFEEAILEDMELFDDDKIQEDSDESHELETFCG